MRTSRLSRDTARIAHALSPNTRASARRALSQSLPVTDGADPSLDDGFATPRKRKASDLESSPPDEKATWKSPRKSIKSEPAKPRRQPARRIKGPDGSVTIAPPTDWEQTYRITAEMRKKVLAPVDTMGCESSAEESASPVDKRLQTLVALMLSSQTKDTVTFAAMRNLQENLPGGFNLQALLDVAPDRLNELIAKVGFHNNKTKYIKATAELLRDQFAGDIPDSIEGLVSLPGVGPKMAYLCMSSAWGRDEGIGVDVHVHRITNLWKWHKTSTPEQTRAELESWLPKDKWHDINHLLVGFGQTICLPVGRRCDECELGKMRLCPSRVAVSPAKKKTIKTAAVKVEMHSGDLVKKEVKVEVDGIGIKLEADLEDEGRISAQGLL